MLVPGPLRRAGVTPAPLFRQRHRGVGAATGSTGLYSASAGLGDGQQWTEAAIVPDETGTTVAEAMVEESCFHPCQRPTESR